MHALIIEDEPLVAMAIEELLRSSGFDSFDFATSVGEAVAAAARRSPDLITSDVMLKPGNGIDAVEEIRAKSPVPVIFITGNAEQVRDRLPACIVVRKPFSEVEVTAAVRSIRSGPAM
jgi:DNA-binding response OmpR family regulator